MCKIGSPLLSFLLCSLCTPLQREKYKKWFVEHQAIFDSTKLYDFWAVDNKEHVEEFKKNFVNAYNAVASRIFAITIKSE